MRGNSVRFGGEGNMDVNSLVPDTGFLNNSPPV